MSGSVDKVQKHCDDWERGVKNVLTAFLADPKYRCAGCGDHTGATISSMVIEPSSGKVIVGGVRFHGAEIDGWCSVTDAVPKAIDVAAGAGPRMFCPACRKSKGV